MLNELYHDANRKGKNLVITTIDFSNAFGSIPHELIMSTMKQRNFPEWMQAVVKDMYTDASSVIEVSGTRSDEIGWRKGVKQGCPLSPLLFNLCIEPLLQTIKRRHEGRGYPVNLDGTTSRFVVQAYADDIVFMSDRKEGIKDMLLTLEEFTSWARMEVNHKKCETASYILDRDGHRRSFRQGVAYKGEEIPNLTFTQSVKYLGVAVASRRNTKQQTTNTKLAEMRQLLEKIMSSHLLTVQKIDAVKTFLLPSIDYQLLNGELSRAKVRELDKAIRAAVSRQLKIRGLPVECHHASWRDGGLSYPSLESRDNVLKIRAFAQMMISTDEKVRTAMRQFAEDERRFRRIGEDDHARFLNWEVTEDERTGTSSIVARARKACAELDISFNLEGISGIRISGGRSAKTMNTAVGIGRFLTQQVIRPKLIDQLIWNHPQRGAAFVTLRENEMSNRVLMDIYTKRTDAFFRFVVAGRADCLPSPSNTQRWYRRQATPCTACGRGQLATLAHILNRCDAHNGLIQARHDKLSKVVMEAVNKYCEVEGEVTEGEWMRIEGLPEEMLRLKPDLVFTQKDGQNQTIELIEFSCPYGYVSHGHQTLEKVYHDKLHKYEPLAYELRRITHQKVRVTAVIVSSMGAVHPESMKNLAKVLKITDKKKIQKLGRRMSETVLVGSMEIWRTHMKRNAVEEAEMDQDEQEIMQQELVLSDYEALLPGEREDEDEEEPGRDIRDRGIAPPRNRRPPERNILDWSAPEDNPGQPDEPEPPDEPGGGHEEDEAEEADDEEPDYLS
jgi:hypothetical protein